jgi:hypothetical protein
MVEAVRAAYLLLAGQRERKDAMKTLVLIALLAGTGAWAQSEKSLRDRAQAAKSVDDHLSVSAEYRAQARELELRVREYGREVHRLQRQPTDAMAMKWRHARPDPLAVASERLVEAKRALQEVTEAAQHHAHVALELRLRGTETASDTPARQPERSSVQRESKSTQGT